METFAFILILAVAVIASQPVAQFARVVPLPIVQIAIGVVLAWPVTGGVHVQLEPEVFLLVFIPPLLFADAWQAPKREFWELRVPIGLMAFGLVFFTIVTFGYALNWMVPAVPLAVAFAAAAVLSPTDAVAVSSIVDKEKLPPSLLHMLEGESLLNDASGLVMFRFATAAALTGAFSLAQASGAFLLAVLLGAAAGFACLWIGQKALRIVAKMPTGADESQVLIVLLLPFMAYLLAERWHASGVLAAVVSGMYAGRMGFYRPISVSARILMRGTWQMVGFVLNGAIFVFLGLQLPSIIRDVPAELAAYHPVLAPIGVVILLTACLMGLRLAFLAASVMMGGLIERLGGPKRHQMNLQATLVASVAGVRGAVTLAGVLSLPLLLPSGDAFPARNLVIFLATGVILCWLAVATLLLPQMTKGLVNDGRTRAALEERHARMAVAQAAIDELQQASVSNSDHTGVTPRQAVALAMIEKYRRRLDGAEQGEAREMDSRATREAELSLLRVASEAELNCLRGLLVNGEINDHTFQKLAAQITLDLAAISARAASA